MLGFVTATFFVGAVGDLGDDGVHIRTQTGSVQRNWTLSGSWALHAQRSALAIALTAWTFTCREGKYSENISWAFHISN